MPRSTINNGQLLLNVRQALNTMTAEIYGDTATTETLLDAVTVTGAGDPVIIPRYKHPYIIDASIAGTGAVSATILIYGQNNNDAPDLLQTITLSGTDSDQVDEPGVIEKFFNSGVWADVTAISGTDAFVTVTTGY